MKIASQNRRTRETRQRDAERRERALLFLTEEETNEALRESRATALSLVNSLSNALTLSVQQKRNSFIRGVLFIIIRTRAPVYEVYLSSVCGKEKTRNHQKRERKRSVTKVNHVLRSGAYTAFFFTEFVFFSVVSAFEGGGGGLSRGRKRRFRAQS